jgi:hypothetical protein
MRSILVPVLGVASFFLASCDIRLLNESDGGGEEESPDLVKSDNSGQAAEPDIQNKASESPSGGEVFASLDPSKCGVGSGNADVYVKNKEGSMELHSSATYKGSDGDRGGVDWVVHSPLDPVTGEKGEDRPYLFQFSSPEGGEAVIWVKTPSLGDGMTVICYYTLDGTEPAGERGKGEGSTQVSSLQWSHNFPIEGGARGDWWKSPPLPTKGVEFRYKIGAFRTVR